MTPLYESIARRLDAAIRCESSDNAVMHGYGADHRAAIDSLCREHMPSGSGFDSGTTFDHDASRPDKFVFRTAFHHMNPVGYYDGWTEHAVTIRPSLAFGFDMRIGGRDRNDIKEYIARSFDYALRQPAPLP